MNTQASALNKSSRAKPARILVMSASVGAGHLRAAQAVELALRELDPEAEVRNVDVLTLTNALFRKLYGQAYLELVNQAPHVLGYVYDLLDKPRRANSGRDRLRRLVQKLNLSKLCKLLECESWDVIVNTHFLPAEIIAQLKRQRKIRTPQIVATTDFETHRLWVHRPVEHYTTATDEGAEYLRRLGVTSSIDVTGIPIHPVFSRPADHAQCAAKHKLDISVPVVLQLAGGFGVGPIASIYRQILSIDAPLQVVVVAGRNEKLRQQLAAIDVPARHRSQIFGFTDKIDELMAVADIVVSKPGGLTTSEALARGAAVAIVNPIPGQESRNSDFLLENGAGIKINNLATLAHKLSSLLTDGRRLSLLKRNSLALARPGAAFDIARLALRYAEAGRKDRLHG
jgi:processive 1,2-diacylglycerol beta-glucosyltransferase